MTAAPTHDGKLSWAQTRALINSDLDRVAAHLNQPSSWRHRLYFFLLPGFLVLFLHRVARYAYLRDWVVTARVIAIFAIYITRSEIPPTASIGPSALISHATSVNIFGRIGARVTISGNVAVGGGMGTTDIGGGPGYPVIGDDVTLAYGACVLGSVRVGDGVRVGPGALVTCDVPAGSLVLWDRPRIVRGGSAGPAVDAAPVPTPEPAPMPVPSASPANPLRASA